MKQYKVNSSEYRAKCRELKKKLGVQQYDESHLIIVETDTGVKHEKLPNDRWKIVTEANEWLTPAKTATILGVSTTTLNTWANKGLIKAHKTLGGQWLYHKAVVEAERAYMDAQKDTGDQLRKALELAHMLADPKTGRYIRSAIKSLPPAGE